MLVRILAETEYKPTRADSPRCFGQLRQRASRIPVEGDETGKTTCGPMMHFFRVGATPELPDDVATELIAAGRAERIENNVVIVEADDLLRTIKAGMSQ